MRNLLYMVMILVAVGCSAGGSRQVKELDEVQRIMQGHPSEAFEKLNAMDISEFRDSATMARWALLYSEAMAANRLCAPTDTIINIALDYYGRHGNAVELQRARALRHAVSSGRQGMDTLVTALYMQKEKEFYLFRERTRKEQYALVALIAVVAAAGIIAWQRQRLRLERAHSDVLIAEASGLKCVLRDSRSSILQMETTLHGLLKSRFALIDSLCDTYYESQGTKAERKAITDKVKAAICSLQDDRDVFAEMENTVNCCRDNLLKKLKDEYPDISAEDYRMTVYLACGMSNRTISLLLGKTIDVVYKRKSRTRSQIKARALPHAAEFEALFSSR